ncbi:MAG: hypothetical protein QM804_04065 [Propionicimonas sp.]
MITNPFSSPTDRLTKATDKRDKWRDSLADLETRLGDAQAQQPDDPSEVEAIATTLATLQHQVRITAASLASAEAAVEAAAKAVAAAEADALEAQVRKAEAELARHDAKRDELRTALEEYTGRRWQVVELPGNVGWIGGAPETHIKSATARKRAALVAKVADLTKRQRVLRLEAEGMPDPAVEAAQRAVERAAEQQAHQDRIAAAQAELDEIAGRYGIRAGQLEVAVNEFYAVPAYQVEAALRSVTGQRANDLRRVGEIADQASFAALVGHFDHLRAVEEAAERRADAEEAQRRIDEQMAAAGHQPVVVVPGFINLPLSDTDGTESATSEAVEPVPAA